MMLMASVSAYPAGVLTKEEFVARYIREAIVAGRLVPGERLRQQQLADELGMSPTPVREALRGLVTEGWLTLTPHIGVSVAEIDHAGIDEVYRLRALLEGDLAREAATLMSADTLRELRDINEAYKRSSRVGDAGAAREANFQFHALIWEAADSPVAVDILNSLWARAPWQTMSGVKGREKRTYEEHSKVIAALAKRDPERAQDALRAHIRSGHADYHARVDAGG